MIELSTNKIAKYYGANKVLNDISFDIQTGEKAGIVGRNGCGKSTLLNIINGRESADTGTLSFRKGATIGCLDQLPDYPDGWTVMDVLDSAFETLHQISSQMKQLEAQMASNGLSEAELARVMNEYAQQQQRFELQGGYSIEEQMSKVCDGLKLDTSFCQQLFSTLSGGEKTTVVLGKILLQNVDIMLLDEPSNHLDMESLEWLEEYLRSYAGTVLIVSHDRYFLDRVATKIIEIEDMDSETYQGNYSDYVQTKEKNLLLQFEAFKDQQKKIAAMEKTVKELRDWGNRSGNEKFYKRAVSIEKRLEKLERIDKPKTEKDSMRMNFVTTGRSGKDVIVVDKLSMHFDAKELFQQADLLIRHGERTALIGRNGCGKSTLIKLLTGELAPSNGSAILGASIKLGYLPQNVVFECADATVLDTFRSDVNLPEGKSREYLARFLFYGESVFKRVSSLSGGERSRLKLAMLMYEEINLLILDEPTNHLDIESMESLEETLRAFNGTIFFISHDRYFINAVSSRIVEVQDLRFASYEGNYDQYKEQRRKERAVANDQRTNLQISTEQETLRRKPVIKSQVRSNCIDKRDVGSNQKHPSKDKPNGNPAYKLTQLEDKISHLETLLSDLDARMLSCSSDGEKLNELFTKRSAIEEELESSMNEWVSIEIS